MTYNNNQNETAMSQRALFKSSRSRDIKHNPPSKPVAPFSQNDMDRLERVLISSRLYIPMHLLATHAIMKALNTSNEVGVLTKRGV